MTIYHCQNDIKIYSFDYDTFRDYKLIELDSKEPA